MALSEKSAELLLSVFGDPGGNGPTDASIAAPVVAPQPNLPGPPGVPAVDKVAPIPTDPKVDEIAIRTAEEAIASLPKAGKYNPVDFNKQFLDYINSGNIPHTGLDEDPVRKTGVNDATHKDTLRYSRMVDALNNKRYISPGQAGVRSTYANAGGRTGRADPIDFGQVYKMDGLETAESRAQKRAEGYEALERGREINRRENVKDMGPELARLNQLAAIEQTRDLYAAEIRERETIYNAMIANRYNLPFQMMQTQYGARIQQLQHMYSTQLSAYLSRIIGINIPADKVALALQYATGKPQDMNTFSILGNILGTGNISAQQAMLTGELVSRGANYTDIPTMLQTYQWLQQQLNTAGVSASDATQKTVGT
jgi:hypothetical protein